MPRIDPVLSLTFATAVASLFFTSVVHKIKDPYRFRDAVSGFALIPEPLILATAIFVLVCECSVVATFILGSTRAAGMCVAGTLMVLYAGAIVVNLLRGRTRIDCGCVGFLPQQHLGWWMVARNAVVATGAFIASLPRAPRELTSMDFFVVICAACAAAALYSAQGMLAHVHRRWQGET